MSEPYQTSSEQSELDEHWMRQALRCAAEAAERGEVPVGAVLVRDGVMLAEASNQPIGSCDPTAHAEISVLREAAKKEKNYRLPGTTLYVTIEPCTMCVGAIIHARVDRLVFGAREPKAGAVLSQKRLLEHSSVNTSVDVTEGVLASECSQLMSDFFAYRRAQKKKLKQAILSTAKENKV